MDSWEWNKIAGALLGTFLFVLGLSILSGALFEVPLPEKPGYIVEGVPSPAETASTAPTEPAVEAVPDFGTVLPAASVSEGQKVAARCQQCHNLEKGGPNQIGPNLWGIVGRARASIASFSYSSAMSSSHDPWTFEKLFAYLKSPQAVVPGTKMAFGGLKSADDRINLIAYLRTLSDSPVAIPAPEPAKAAAAMPAPAAPATPAAATTVAAATSPAPAAATGPDMASADVAHGKEVSGRCQQCHNLEKGGPNLIGPNLWGIVGRARASVASFSYSSAMSANHDPWTVDKLFVYLKQPQMMVPGTKMSFAGLSSTKDRTDLIAYLRTLSDTPPAK
jgi:cytochrome c